MDSEPTISNAHVRRTEDSNPFEVGQVLDGKYEILSLLGKGGMGSVYRVRHKLLNVELALKTLDTQRLGDAASSRRFQTEAKAAFSLKHPCLVKVHDFGVLESGHPFLVMDLVQGTTLQNLIKEKGKLSFSEIEAIFVQLCFGLQHAHQQKVVHRDIKPGNIMIVDGIPLAEEGSVKILDFGIAKIVGSDRGEMEALTQTGEIFGSPLYMSPEQCAGEAIDQRSDIYSLGCVLFEALTGTTPLVGSNPLRTMMLHVNEKAPTLKEAALGEQYPPAFEQIVAKMLAKSPADRYSELGVVAHELYRACTGNSYKRGIANDIVESSLKPERKHSITFSYLQLGGLLTAVAAVSIVGTLSIDHFRRAYLEATKQPVKMRTEPTYALIVHPNDKPSDDFKRAAVVRDRKIDKAYAEVESIKAEEIIDAGKKKLKIVFPNFAIGKIRCSDPDMEKCRFGPKLSASNTLTIDADNQIIFNISDIYNNDAFARPYIFEKIDSNLFTGLDMESGSEGSEVISGSDLADTRAPHESVVKLFEIASGWNRLTFVNFRNFEVTDDIVRIMNKFPHLTYFSLITETYDAKSIAKQPFFRKISRLLVKDGDVNALLKGLSHSRAITDIFLGGNTRFSAESIASLSTCPNLKSLSLTSPQYDDATIHALKGLTQVGDLSINTVVLTPLQLAEFNEYRKLVRIK